MTPQERKLIDELFDRLASLEDAPRDDDAVQAINEGLERAPNAMYPLVQTALVQDEALKRADSRIRELEAELGVGPGEPVRQPGFLDNMRDALRGRTAGRGSVPTVRPGQPSSAWGSASTQPGPGTQPGYGAQLAEQPSSSGSSFLGTAAATAAGVLGGALLMNSIRGLSGGPHQSFGSLDPGGAGSPWGGSSSGGDLSRDAGLNDIGGGDGHGGASQQAGLFDASPGDDRDLQLDNDNGDFDVGGDFGGGDGGGDTA
jgi:hypothetical protein